MASESEVSGSICLKASPEADWGGLLVSTLRSKCSSRYVLVVRVEISSQTPTKVLIPRPNRC